MVAGDDIVKIGEVVPGRADSQGNGEETVESQQWRKPRIGRVFHQNLVASGELRSHHEIERVLQATGEQDALG